MAAFIGDAQALAEEGDNGDYQENGGDLWGVYERVNCIFLLYKIYSVFKNKKRQSYRIYKILTVTSNILTKFGEVIVTSDENIFMTEGSGVE